MKKAILIALLALAVIFAVPFIVPPGTEVVTTTIINAPPARVWAVLTDLPHYAAWNPTMRLRGALVRGATIENREGPPGADMVFHPTVTAVKPERELRWFGRVLLPRLFDANHYFLLQRYGAGTKLIQGEKLHGIGIWLLDLSGLRPAEAAVNAALKAEAEKAP